MSTTTMDDLLNKQVPEEENVSPRLNPVPETRQTERQLRLANDLDDFTQHKLREIKVEREILRELRIAVQNGNFSNYNIMVSQIEIVKRLHAEFMSKIAHLENGATDAFEHGDHQSASFLARLAAKAKQAWYAPTAQYSWEIKKKPSSDGTH